MIEGKQVSFVVNLSKTEEIDTMKENEIAMPEAKIEKERYSLEGEIEEIKRKLERLQY